MERPQLNDRAIIVAAELEEEYKACGTDKECEPGMENTAGSGCVKRGEHTLGEDSALPQL